MPKTAQEYFDATRGGNYESGYDIVADVMTKHFPVVSGLVMLAVVLVSPFVYEWYIMRSGKKRDKTPNPTERPRLKEEEAPTDHALENDRKTLAKITEILDQKGEPENGEGEKAAVTMAGDIKDPAIRAEAMSLVGIFFEKKGDQSRALEFARSALFCFDLADATQKVEKTTEWIGRLKAVSK